MDFIRFLFNKAIFVILAFAGAFGLVKGEEILFYKKVAVEIVSVEEKCRFSREEPFSITPYGACDAAYKRLVSMQAKDYKLVESYRVRGTFISPVDNQQHIGWIYYSLNSDKLPQIGDRTTLLASKKKKTKLKHIS